MELQISSIIDLLVNKVEAWMVELVRMLPNFVLAVCIFLIFLYLGKVFRTWSGMALSRVSGHRTLVRLVGGLLFSATVAVGLFVALGILNLDKTVTSLLAGAGVLGLALGFAFQEIASNFLSGIFLAFEKPIREGDIVRIQGYEGTVKAIYLRTTVIREFDGSEVQVPNKNVFTDVLSNLTSTLDRRVDLTVGVSYGENLREVEKVSRKALEGVSHRIKDRPVEVYFTEFADSSINFQARVWINFSNQRQFLEARHEAVIFIKEAFDAKGITIPFPIRTLDFGIKGGATLKEQIGESDG